MIKILVAEDEHLSCSALVHYLQRRLGASALIEGVFNGRAAVDRAREVAPQLIFMDIEMPLLSGLEAAEIIRQELPACKIIFLTAFDRFDYAVGAVRTGASDYLLKPFDRESIDACLRKFSLLPEDEDSDENLTPFQRQFTVWLKNHYAQDISLEAAAESAGMSTFYFSRLFRTSFGKTFVEYLAWYRIQRAQQLLDSTEIPVREVAQRVGYADSNYFSKVFKRQVGVTPTQYRQK